MSEADGARGARLLVGNLDCESDFAAAAGRRRVAPARRALETIAGAATLLRAFARQGDRLWLPAAVAPERLADVPGLPRPTLESGPLASRPPAGEVLAWGETAEVAGLRRDAPRNAERPALRDLALRDLPWRLPRPAPEVAATVNDRAFCWRLAGELGCRLPGARIVASPGEVPSRPAAVGRRGWVLKAAFSAAGRWRYVHRGGQLGAGARRRIERLFERHGPLLLEPWMERTADFGCAAALTADGPRPISLHRLLVDSGGRFTGVELLAGGRGLDGPWLAAAERATLERVLAGVSAALGRAGYRGPFGLDAWRHRRAGGGEAFHPLGEINARMTFGLVARALVDRLRRPLGLDPEARVRLVFGRREERGHAGVVPLFQSPVAGGREIRLEIRQPVRGRMVVS